MIRLVREINNEDDLRIAVEETRRVLLHNDPSLVEDCVVEKILHNVKRMQEMDVDWTVEDELADLIMESWGEDN